MNEEVFEALRTMLLSSMANESDPVACKAINRLIKLAKESPDEIIPWILHKIAKKETDFNGFYMGILFVIGLSYSKEEIINGLTNQSMHWTMMSDEERKKAGLQLS